MKDIKKLMITLVALLAVTTGAWADDYFYMVISGTSGTLKYGSEYTENDPYLEIDDGWHGGGSYYWVNMGDLTAVTIDASCNNYNGTSLNVLFGGFSGLTTINGLDNLNTVGVQDMTSMFAGCSSLTALDLSSWNTASVETLLSMFDGCSSLTTLDLSSWNTASVETLNSMFYGCSSLTTVDLSSWNTAKVWITYNMFRDCSNLENIYVGDGWSTAKVTDSEKMFNGCTKLLSMNTANPATDKTNAHTGDGGYLKVKPAASSGPEVAWDKATKTGTFTMPGGNVTLEPEYYPQATVADGGVTAADADARATTDDPLVKVDATKLTGATKLMYFVSNSGTTAPAYDAEGWTDQLPTAEGITQQGIVYVWYYPVGTDEGVDDATATYSDGDICLQSIIARIAPEPTYTVEFAEGTDANEWKAEPNTGVKKGQPVTVTYTGAKKVIGVKAEKKGGAAGIVNPAVGQVIGSDGNNYDANATLPDGVTKVAMIAYVSGSNGLALALTEEGIYTWDNSSPSNGGKTAPEICSELNTSKAVTGCTWKLPSMDEWQQMFSANGGNEGSYTGLNNALAAAGGESSKLLEGEEYWSSSEVDEGYAWLVYLADGNAIWDNYGKHYSRYVRACLAF